MPFQTPPSFSTGQIISAEAQLNVLAENVEQLFSAVYTARPFLIGYRYSKNYLQEGFSQSGPWQRLYKAYIYHYFPAPFYTPSVQITYDIKTVEDALNIRIQLVNPLTGQVYSDTWTESVGQNTTKTRTIALSSTGWSITRGNFYYVTIDVYGFEFVGADDSFLVLGIAERASQSYSAHPNFAIGTSPTATQWNNLSLAQSSVNDSLATPHSGFVGIGGVVNNETQSINFNSPNAAYASALKVDNDANDLIYQFRMEYPGSGEYRVYTASLRSENNNLDSWGWGYLKSPGISTTDTTLTISEFCQHAFHPGDVILFRDGAAEEHIRLGSQSASNVYINCERGVDETPIYAWDIGSEKRNFRSLRNDEHGWYTTEKSDGSVVFVGEMYNPYGTGGQFYTVTINGYIYQPTDDNLPKNLHVYFEGLFESASKHVPTSWISHLPQPRWGKGDFITDGGGPASIASAMNDLQTLVTQTGFFNPACVKYRPEVSIAARPDIVFSPIYFIRKHRWLYWMFEHATESVNASISYRNNPAIALSGTPNEWQLLDLNTLSGLYVGAEYTLKGVSYAIEVPELPSA